MEPVGVGTNSRSHPCLAQDFVLLTLLTGWLVIPDGMAVPPLELIEYFAGRARVAKMAFRRGYSSRALDIIFTKPKAPKIDSFSKPRGSMDFNGSAGYVFLFCAQRIKCFIYELVAPRSKSFEPITTPCGSVLCHCEVGTVAGAGWDSRRASSSDSCSVFQLEPGKSTYKRTGFPSTWWSFLPQISGRR